jgi:hypothetical protein
MWFRSASAPERLLRAGGDGDVIERPGQVIEERGLPVGRVTARVEATHLEHEIVTVVSVPIAGNGALAFRPILVLPAPPSRSPSGRAHR